MIEPQLDGAARREALRRDVRRDGEGVAEGPYFVDEKLNRTDIRVDPNTGSMRPGLPLTLTFNVFSVGSISLIVTSLLAFKYVEIVLLSQ